MITTQHQVHLASHNLQETAPEHAILKARKRWIAALYLGAVLGLLSGGLGLAFCVLPYIVPTPALAGAVRAAPAMLAVAFPLLIFAAHCLDKIAETEKKAKIEFLNQIGRG